MTKSEIYSCLRDLQVVGTVPRLTEEQMDKLTKMKLIERNTKLGRIWLTPLGVDTKTGQI
jgi:hypothetical protein